MKKLLKKKSILHKKKIKKVSKKVSTNVHRKSKIQIGGSGESLSILYNGQSIVNDSNITGIIDYSKAPQITINNSDMNKIYLITMTDPDAPNGIENKRGNFTYTHWVFTQKGNNNKSYNEFVSYTPPSPPKGTHRYIFKLYDVSMIDTKELKVNNNNNADYYKTILQPFLNNKNNTIKLLSNFQFIVNNN